MKEKEVANPDSPGGRKDWEGRTPRWRTSWVLPKFLILKEVMEDYFNRYPERRNTQDYMVLYDEIIGIIQQMQKPLTRTVEKSDLF